MELLVTTVSVAVIITGLHWTVAGQSVTTRDGDGLDAADDATSSVTCDFENGLCGWRNITQQVPSEDYGLKWKLGFFAATPSHYVFIDVAHVAAGNKGGLASPKLPQRPGDECELSFEYCFVGACALQVAVVVEDDTGEVKEITQYNRTGPTTCRVSDGSATVNCSKSAYWVYFVGEVLSNDNSNCGRGAAIVVDNIEYNVKNRRTSPAPVASTPVPTVATTSTTTTNPATTADATLPLVSVRDKPESQSGGLGSGAVAAVIVVVVAVVVVVVVVLVLVLRRRRGHDGGLTICLQKIQRKPSVGKPSTSAGASTAYTQDDSQISALSGSAAALRGGLGKVPGAEAHHVYTNDTDHVYKTDTDHEYKNGPEADRVYKNEPEADHVYKNEPNVNHVYNIPDLNPVYKNEPDANHMYTDLGNLKSGQGHRNGE